MQSPSRGICLVRSHLARVCWLQVRWGPVKDSRPSARLERPVWRARPAAPVPTILGGIGRENHRHQKSSGAETLFLLIPEWFRIRARAPIPVLHQEGWANLGKNDPVRDRVCRGAGGHASDRGDSVGHRHSSCRHNSRDRCNRADRNHHLPAQRSLPGGG